MFVAGISWSGMSGGDGKGKHDGRKKALYLYDFMRTVKGMEAFSHEIIIIK